MFKFLKKIFHKKDLEFNAKIWKTETCYFCGKPYNKEDFYTGFTEINGALYQVPMCDDCAGPSIKEAPSNR
jgi:hypothetical protein